ncbi:MAG: NINE protein [Eubacterium sp.]|nr:NINE protein [Eubacterium sp.]MCM1217079.1 NINE protein [Lachnospiraceae bacterium]MCM1304685.1 NINE protein [Butyrivibrio sp.]MCM1344977.1 NINE protein [Muribaculaceae bacterium]MCM1239147.1 NINE protein [Lachnospiraceae bacterium]
MYFCKNCGEVYPAEDAVMCAKCGVSKGRGSRYCHVCGRLLDPGQTICMNCGAAHRAAGGSGAKSRQVAGMLGIFLGGFGVHNFYLGYTTKAVTQLMCIVAGWLASCFGVGVLVVLVMIIWGIVEGIMILSGRIDTDGQGDPLRD